MRHDPGRVYIATNGRWVKVGRTQQPVPRRIAQLNHPLCEYARFGPWRYVSHVYSSRHSALEALAHRRLRRWRVRAGSCREVFAVSPEKAMAAIMRPPTSRLRPSAGRLLAVLAFAVLTVFLALLIGATP